ncbi:MAG: PAS domain S-box protein [Bacteroidales bacterium]|nr:PAS domain S-box protein [Bacteroidales bacterium]
MMKANEQHMKPGYPSGKILVVDDIHDNLRLIEIVLKKNLPAYSVLLARSGKACLELASTELPDTILLDVNMPEMNGFDVCRVLKADPRTSGIPVLMISAYGNDSQIRIGALRSGADAFIAKPFNHAELIALVNAMLRIKSAEDLLKRQNSELELLIRKQLNESSVQESRLLQISDFVNEFFWEVNESLLFTYVSPTVMNVLGYSSDELSHKYHLYDLLAEENREAVKAHITLVTRKTGNFDRFTLRCKTNDGDEAWLMLSGFPFFDAENRFLGYRGAFQNITQRMLDEEKHAMVINTSLDGFVMTDADNIIIETNEAYCRITGYSAAELTGSVLTAIDISEASLSSRKKMHTGFTESEYVRFETKHPKKNGQFIDVEVSINLFKLIESRKFIFIRDISERKLIEAAQIRNLEMIEAYQTRLKHLQAKLIHAEEQERKKMAAFLHDGIGQSLAIAYLKLSSLARPKSSEKADMVIGDTLSLIDKAIRESRLLTYDLSPPILHELGLVSALKWKLDKVGEEFGLETTLNCSVDNVHVRNETAILLYRVFSELLNNIIKHAEATEVIVRIRVEQELLTIEIIDNGKGFDMKSLSTKTEGYGLFNIRERIASILGKLDIYSEPGKGTRVKLFIP